MGKFGFAQKLKSLFGIYKSESDEFYEALTDALIEGDTGAATAVTLVDDLQKICREEKLSGREQVTQRLFLMLKDYVKQTSLEVQEGKAVTDGTAQNASDDVTCTCIGRQLPVGDGKSHGAQVVGDHAQGHVHIMFLAIANAGVLRNLLDDRVENVRVIVGFLVLDGHTKAFEAHTRIHMLGS